MIKDFTKEDLFLVIKDKQLDLIKAYNRYLPTTNNEYFYTEYTGVCLWWLGFEPRKRLKLARQLEKDGRIGLIKIHESQYNSPLKAYIINTETQAS